MTAAAYDFQTGLTSTWHPGETEATASIVKVDIMAVLFAQLTASGQQPSASDLSLLTSMIEVSDNSAATSLWNNIGGPSELGSFDSSIGMTQTVPSSCLSCPGFPWPGWGLTTTTAGDQLTLLKELVDPNSLISTADREEALSLLESVISSERWGVTGGVPAGVEVALKNGWVPLQNGLWQINSIGWINGGGHDYLLAILSNGNPTEQYGIDTVTTLSSYVWAALGTSGASRS